MAILSNCDSFHKGAICFFLSLENYKYCIFEFKQNLHSQFHSALHLLFNRNLNVKTTWVIDLRIL